MVKVRDVVYRGTRNHVLAFPFHGARRVRRALPLREGSDGRLLFPYSAVPNPGAAGRAASPPGSTISLTDRVPADNRPVNKCSEKWDNNLTP